MANDNELKVIIGTEGDQLKAGMSDAKGVVENAVQSMNSAFNGLSSTASSIATNIKGNFAAIGASIVAAISVEGFKKAVEGAQEYDAAVLKLSRTMGMTTEAASQMSVALRLIGSSTDAYESANMKLDRQLKKNESSLNQIGVVTRSSSGALLSQQQVFQNALTTLGTYKEGIDRNEASLYMFGRSAAEIQTLMKLNNAVMNEAAEIAKKFGIVIGDEAAAQSAKLSKETRILGLAFDSIKIQLGNALIPAIKDLMGGLAGFATNAIPAAITQIRLINVVFSDWKEEIIAVAAALAAYMVASIASSVRSIGKLIVATKELIVVMEILATRALAAVASQLGLIGLAVGGVVYAFQRLSRTDAVEAQISRLETLRATLVKTGQSVADVDFQLERLKKLLPQGGEMKGFASQYDVPDKTESSIPKGYQGFTAPDTSKGKQAKSRLPDWKQELEQMKEAENAFFGYSLEKEREFWQQKLALAKGHPTEYREVTHQLYEVDKEQHKNALDTAIEAQKAIIASDKSTADQKIAAAEKIVALNKNAYTQDSKNYELAMKEREKVVEQEARKEAELRAKTITDDVKILNDAAKAEETHYNHLYELGQISATKQIELQKQSEQDRYMGELQLLGKEAALLQEWPKLYEAALDKIKAAVQKHNAEIVKLNDKADLEQKKQWDQLANGIGSAMDTALKGVIMGTTTLKQAMANMAQSILSTFINASAKMAMQWISDRLREAVMGTAAKTAAAQSETATTAQSEATSSEIVAEGAMAKVGSNAAVAASGAASAEASIPYAGPFLAAAAAGAMLAMVLGYESMISSAAGGYDIPSGINPVVQTHAEEMILPAELANKVRGMTTGGGGASVVHNHHYNIQAWDSKDVGRFLKGHSNELAKAGVHAARHGQVGK